MAGFGVFCTVCAAPIEFDRPRCPVCGTASVADHRAATATRRGNAASRRRFSSARHHRALALLRLLPVVALLVGLTSWSVDAYRVRQEEARGYRAAGDALARGDLLSALSLYAKVGDYADAPRRASELKAQIVPYIAEYNEGVAALEAGDFETALARFQKVADVLPGYGDLDAKLAEAKVGHIARLRAEADRAYAAADWLRAERLFTKLAALAPDDPDIAATLADLRRDHALFVFTQHGVLMRAVPDSAAMPIPVIDAPTASWPVWSPDRSKIAFISPGDANNGMARGLFVVDPDGSNLKKLADSPARYQRPVWSPDGTRIAITVDRVTAQHTSMGPSVIVIDVATGQALDIADRALPNASSPTWSPSGDRIAFVSRAVERLTADSSVPDDILRVDRSSVYVYDFATRQTTTVGGDALPEPFRIAWSPAAERLLVFSRKDGTSFSQGKLYLIDIPSNTVSVIDGASKAVSMPVWSPDGGRFAYVIGSSVIRVVELTGDEIVLKSSVDLAGTLTWSPSGDRILAGGEVGIGFATIVRVEPSGATVSEISLAYDASGGDAGPPDWAGLRGAGAPATHPEDASGTG